MEPLDDPNRTLIHSCDSIIARKDLKERQPHTVLSFQRILLPRMASRLLASTFFLCYDALPRDHLCTASCLHKLSKRSYDTS